MSKPSHDFWMEMQGRCVHEQGVQKRDCWQCRYEAADALHAAGFAEGVEASAKVTDLWGAEKIISPEIRALLPAAKGGAK